MTPDQLLAIYDNDQRRNITYPNVRREVTPHVVRLVDLHGTFSWVLYSQLTTENADSVIAGEIAYFAALGHDFEWKLYAHDAPNDLKERLISQGFTVGDEEAIVVLPISEAPPELFVSGEHDVRHITDPDNLGDILTIENTVWGEDHSSLVEYLAAEKRAAPDMLSIYIAYVDGKPASCAWTRFAPNSQFASLWGGATIAQYRGRGIYRALVAARAIEARQRGIAFFCVDASPMSRPILERFGFQTITRSWECTYELEKDAQGE
jgi:hypothetical protein